MTQRLTYAPADSSLERAAEEMVRHRFRHMVVLDGSEVVGILSMRDIVRCWTQGAAGTPPGMSTSSAAATTGRSDSAESPGARQLSQTQ